MAFGELLFWIEQLLIDWMLQISFPKHIFSIKLVNLISSWGIHLKNLIYTILLSGVIFLDVIDAWCLMILRAKSILQWKFVLNVIYYSSCFSEYIERLVSSLLCKYWWLRTFGTHVFCSLFLRRLAEHTTHNSSILIHLSILEQKKLISWRSPSE